jgi:hypothetical protein
MPNVGMNRELHTRGKLEKEFHMLPRFGWASQLAVIYAYATGGYIANVNGVNRIVLVVPQARGEKIALGGTDAIVVATLHLLDAEGVFETMMENARQRPEAPDAKPVGHAVECQQYLDRCAIVE